MWVFFDTTSSILKLQLKLIKSQKEFSREAAPWFSEAFSNYGICSVWTLPLSWPNKALNLCRVPFDQSILFSSIWEILKLKNPKSTITSKLLSKPHSNLPYLLRFHSLTSLMWIKLSFYSRRWLRMAMALLIFGKRPENGLREWLLIICQKCKLTSIMRI